MNSHAPYTMSIPTTAAKRICCPCFTLCGFPADVSHTKPPQANKNAAIMGTATTRINSRILCPSTNKWQSWQGFAGVCPHGTNPVAATASGNAKFHALASVVSTVTVIVWPNSVIPTIQGLPGQDLTSAPSRNTRKAFGLAFCGRRDLLSKNLRTWGLFTGAGGAEIVTW